MKKLYSTGKIHPSSPPANISDHLSLLPATILTLAVALPPQDRQVLAYIISCSQYSSNNFSGHHKGRPTRDVSGGEHPPEFECSCFRCYMSYWVRWDSSPNREIIHEIIDAYEDGLLQKKKKKNNYVKNGKERRKRNSSSNPSDNERKGELKEKKLVEVTFQGDDVEEIRGEEELEKGGSVRKIVSFLGERVWGVFHFASTAILKLSSK